VVKTDKCLGVSQLLGGVPGLPPKSTPMDTMSHGSHLMYSARQSTSHSSAQRDLKLT